VNKKQAMVLLAILFAGWGLAYAVAHYTERRGLAVIVFLATLAVFCYWPLSRRKGK
jgi:hypothetical protein